MFQADAKILAPRPRTILNILVIHYTTHNHAHAVIHYHAEWTSILTGIYGHRHSESGYSCLQRGGRLKNSRKSLDVLSMTTVKAIVARPDKMHRGISDKISASEQTFE